MPESLLSPVDYQSIKQNFLSELQKADTGQPSSLPYLKHTLPEKPLVTQGIIQGIVIGGTNYITSTQELHADGTITLIDKKTGILPIIADKHILISFLQEHHDERATAVGLNFGFAMEAITGPFGELDGKVIMTSKEHAFEGILGHAIGDIVREAYGKHIPVVVANDTICLALAGDGTEDGSLISGTGFNIGIVQKENGRKVVINLEAGEFNQFESTEVLTTIDAQSERPGGFLFDKMISGKYLAMYFNVRAEKMGIQHTPVTTSQELSALSHEENDHDANLLARALLERSAFLVGTALASVYEFLNKPQLTFIGEGSMLWLGWEYQNNIQKQLTTLGVPKNALHIKHIKGSSLIGAIGLLTK